MIGMDIKTVLRFQSKACYILVHAYQHNRSIIAIFTTTDIQPASEQVALGGIDVVEQAPRTLPSVQEGRIGSSKPCLCLYIVEFVSHLFDGQ